MNLSFLQEVHLLVTFGIYDVFSSSLLILDQKVASLFRFVVLISLFFNCLLTYINHFDHQVSRYPRELGMSKYINAINIQLNTMSLLTTDPRTLLLLRYLSWIFTYPFILQLDRRVTGQTQEYNVHLSSFFAVGCFLFAWLDKCYPCFFFQCWIALFTVLFPWYYNRHTRIKYRRTSYINISWTLYLVVYLVYHFRAINEMELCVVFAVLDMMSKFIFTYSYQMFLVKQMSDSFATVKLVRTFYPMIEMAVQNHVVSQEEYETIKNHLDVSRDDIDGLKHQLIEDLFPNEAWKDVLSPLKRHTFYPKMCVMFCDLVGYSTYAMNHPLSKVIQHIDLFYTNMDMLIRKHDVQKVETIGDAYLIVSKSPENIIACAMSFLHEYSTQIRVGIHIGEVAACTLGMSKLRYAFVGHTVNVASRLETTGIPGKIHVSEDFFQEFSKLGLKKYTCVQRSPVITLKGIGDHQTYFIEPA